MSTATDSPWADEDVQPVQDAVLAHFHSPDSQHATWWIDTYETATAVLDALAPRVAEIRLAAYREGYAEGIDTMSR